MSDVGNYRSYLFNITCTASKNFEKLILSRVFFSLNPFSFEQFVFQSSQGCCLQHLLYHDFNSKSNDNGSCVDVVSSAFRNAFDMLPRQILISKLLCRVF